LPDAPEFVHGTCVALGRKAALLRGPPGSGKSDLALRFLFLARRGPAALDPPALVADDQVCIRRDGERVLATAPDSIRGQMEVRALGIVGVKAAAEAEVVLVVELVDPGAVPRMPAPDSTFRLAGVDLPLLQLAPLEASAPIKLALAIARARGGTAIAGA
jgi:serine kinase of HPr protein (carbohydrate metabolism regulator)